VLDHQSAEAETRASTRLAGGYASPRHIDLKLVATAAQRTTWSGHGNGRRDGENLSHTQGSAQDSML
jgi:hypothetical protein